MVPRALEIKLMDGIRNSKDLTILLQASELHKTPSSDNNKSSADSLFAKNPIGNTENTNIYKHVKPDTNFRLFNSYWLAHNKSESHKEGLVLLNGE